VEGKGGWLVSVGVGGVGKEGGRVNIVQILYIQVYKWKNGIY
jgi:hypothetical protein